jgi:transposase
MRKSNPKKLGRKPGEGEFTRRMGPEPTEPIIEVPLTHAGGDEQQPRCMCGGCVEVEGSERVTVTLMPRIEPRVRAWNLATGKCRTCGRKWRAKHPDIPADQSGATAHRVAPEVYATAHTLQYKLGLTTRKVANLLRTFFNMGLSQMAITQSALHAAHNRLGRTYGQAGRRHPWLKRGLYRRHQLAHQRPWRVLDDLRFRPSHRLPDL